jgi:outer membrane protein TolC
VLLRRPDVQAARHRAVAQDHRIGAAIAEYFPRFTLDASLGWRSFNGFEGLFDNFIYTVAGQLGATLFQGGRRKAEVRRNRALLEERLGAFAQQVLVALREVEDALVEEREQVRLVGRLDRQVDAARATLVEARLRYVNGLSDFLPVLTALQGLQDAERQRVAAQRELLARRVRLHRALGGTWQEDRIERRLLGERAS